MFKLAIIIYFLSATAEASSSGKLYSCDAVAKGAHSFKFQLLKSSDGKFAVKSDVDAIDNFFDGEGAPGRYEINYKKITVATNEGAKNYEHFSGKTPLFYMVTLL